MISFALFLSINYLLIPAVRRYRERYEQYLPLHAMSGSLVQHTNSLKTRIGDKIMAYILPRFQADIDRRVSLDNGEELFDHEEGEDMVGFDDIRDIERRRAQLRREVGDMQRSRRSEEDYGEVR